ncbi:MAG: hypothetical protein AB7N73_14465 [Gemmatimonadales bacterium]
MTPALWLLLGLAIGVALAAPVITTLHRELSGARAALDATGRQAIGRADHLGELLDRVRAEAVPPAPAPPEPAPEPLPMAIEAAIDGFTDPEVQDEMRDRARTLLRIDPTRDPEQIVGDLLNG